MSLSLTILGSSGSYPGPGRACSSYLLRSPTTTLVMDLGPGALANLQRHVDVGDVEALLLTHEHPDHWIETPSLRVAMRYYLGLEGLPVYGTAGTRRLAGQLIDDPDDSSLVWSVIDADSKVRIGDLSLRFSRTDHPVETLAVRIDQDADTGGRSLVYSADTGPGWQGQSFVAGADLFLCEATVPTALEGSGAPHLSGREAGKLAREAGAGRLLLTHIAPDVDPGGQQRDAESAFGGSVLVACDNETYNV